MESGRLYLDNAATSFPKPPEVANAVLHQLTHVGASAGRGGYREALDARQTLETCRGAIRRLLSCRVDDPVIFGLNGTDALNTLIKGLVQPGDHVVTTTLEHNSVLRPLAGLAARHGLEWTSVEPDLESTVVSPAAIAAAIRSNTRLVVITHASNVTGAIQPIAEIGEHCRKHGIFSLVDGAQSVGHLPLRFRDLPIDALACSGHKGLLGPLGTGVLILRAGAEVEIVPLREGGTGSASERPEQPDFLPDRLESGSANVPGIAGLLAGVSWLLDRGIESVRTHEIELCARLMERLEQCAGLRWFGPRFADQRVGVFSLRIDGFEPSDLSAILESQFGILTRSGFHCAPLAHRLIGTSDSGGTTRVSFGPFTTSEDVDRLALALESLCWT